jgi:hypothetical protein
MKRIVWIYVALFLRDYDLVEKMGSGTVDVLRRYIMNNPVTVRKCAVMLSVYSTVMTVAEIERALCKFMPMV